MKTKIVSSQNNHPGCY